LRSSRIIFAESCPVRPYFYNNPNPQLQSGFDDILRGYRGLAGRRNDIAHSSMQICPILKERRPFVPTDRFLRPEVAPTCSTPLPRPQSPAHGWYLYPGLYNSNKYRIGQISGTISTNSVPPPSPRWLTPASNCFASLATIRIPNPCSCEVKAGRQPDTVGRSTTNSQFSLRTGRAGSKWHGREHGRSECAVQNIETSTALGGVRRGRSVSPCDRSCDDRGRGVCWPSVTSALQSLLRFAAGTFNPHKWLVGPSRYMQNSFL
jgi:hypothetical protein